MAGGGARWKMYMAVFLMLAAVVSGYAVWRQLSRHENFEEVKDDDNDSSSKAKAKAKAAKEVVEVDTQSGSSLGSSKEDYAKRKYVLTVFDTVLHRKATQTEVTKYAALDGEAAILSAIVADYDVLPQPTAASPASTSVPAASTPAPAPASAEVQPRDPDSSQPLAAVEEGFGSLGEPLPASNPTASTAKATTSEAAAGRVYLDREDVVKRLRSISAEVNQFYQMVQML